LLFISKASKFKHAALALGAASLMVVQAQATEVQAQSPQPMPVATFSQADINTMFEQAGQPMQLAALSGQEMKDTGGLGGSFLLLHGHLVALQSVVYSMCGAQGRPQVFGGGSVRGPLVGYMHPLLVEQFLAHITSLDGPSVGLVAVAGIVNITENMVLCAP
jgi:hypothetical protein